MSESKKAWGEAAKIAELLGKTNSLLSALISAAEQNAKNMNVYIEKMQSQEERANRHLAISEEILVQSKRQSDALERVAEALETRL